MKITFKNNAVKLYNNGDSEILKPYLLANMKYVCVGEDEFVLPNHFEADVERIIDDLYYDQEGCIGCDNDRYGGAAGYCASCWTDVYGCRDEDDYMEELD